MPLSALTGTKLRDRRLAAGLRQAQVVAMSVWGFGERRRGKRARVAAVIGEPAVREALFIVEQALIGDQRFDPGQAERSRNRFARLAKVP